MKKLHEYEQHAAECRDMARAALSTHRAQLEQMAATWEQLAEARRRQLARQGKTQEDDAADDTSDGARDVVSCPRGR